jgi:hypothetical protein
MALATPSRNLTARKACVYSHIVVLTPGKARARDHACISEVRSVRTMCLNLACEALVAQCGFFWGHLFGAFDLIGASNLGEIIRTSCTDLRSRPTSCPTVSKLWHVQRCTSPGSLTRVESDEMLEGGPGRRG